MTLRIVDLRSDTVSLPTEKMRLAMQRAEVGDSKKGEDPCVNTLQEMAAALLGKEAGLFLPSGTMSNLVAVMTHCRPGDRAVVGSFSHIFNTELDGMTRIAGVMPQPVPDPEGILDPEAVETILSPRSEGPPRTSLVCLENTHNQAGGAVATLQEIGAVAAVARHHGIPVHLDGARLFNAAVALKVDARELVREADTVAFCLSKGLAAPVGSLLVGRKDFIRQADYAQKILGGAMRQAGHLAAAGIVALQEMIPRLVEDHQNARYLAEMLADLPIISVEPGRVESNIIVFNIDSRKMTRDHFLKALDERGIRISKSGKYRSRMVTHHGVGREDMAYTAQVIKAVVGTR